MSGGMGHPQRTRGDSSRALGQDRTWWNGEHGHLVHFSPSAHVQVCHHLWVQGGTGFPTPALTEKDSLSLSATEGTASKPPWAWPAVSYAKLQPLPINKAKKKKSCSLFMGNCLNGPSSYQSLLTSGDVLYGCALASSSCTPRTPLFLILSLPALPLQLKETKLWPEPEEREE